MMRSYACGTDHFFCRAKSGFQKKVKEFGVKVERLQKVLCRTIGRQISSPKLLRCLWPSRSFYVAYISFTQVKQLLKGGQQLASLTRHYKTLLRLTRNSSSPGEKNRWAAVTAGPTFLLLFAPIIFTAAAPYYNFRVRRNGSPVPMAVC